MPKVHITAHSAFLVSFANDYEQKKEVEKKRPDKEPVQENEVCRVCIGGSVDL